MNSTALSLAITLLITGTVAGVAANAEDLPQMPVVQFQYRTGTVTKEFLAWVAKFGARASAAYDSNLTVDDYVKALCGEAAPENVDLFKRTIAEQGLQISSDEKISKPEGDVLHLPPCLPVSKSRSVARLVLPGDNFWNYYTQSGITPGFDMSAVNSRSPFDALGNVAMDFDVDVASDAGIDAFGKITERYLNKGSQSFRADGQLALDAFLAANALKREGVFGDSVTTSVLDSLDTMRGQPVTSEIKAGVEAAMKKWSGNNGLPSDSWKKVLASANMRSGVDTTPEITWFYPTPSGRKSPSSLQTGDIVVVPQTQNQFIEIPVDYSLLSQDSSESALAYLKKNPPPNPIDETSVMPVEVALSETQPIDPIKEGTCDGALYDMWGTPEFAGRFAATAMRNRMLAYRAGVRTFKADIVIVDSGFVRAMDAAPFTEDAFTQITDLLHEQTAPASLGSKRAHGTMVAGLALGGPQLWGMTSSLGLEVKITPATVFDVRMQNGVQTPLFRTQWLLDAIGGDGDIFNISLASKDEAQMNAFSRYIGKEESKLFVVAAGNNYMNNDTMGVDINDTELFPQRFGGNERGPNLITVAAYDGKGLATFSNYSESYVSIAAPGCAVASWTPNPDNSRYIEQKVTGTSFASPIVAHVAAIVKALMPIRYAQPRYVRARILAGSDLRSDINGVEDGRLLNPIKTISIYEDVLEIEKDGARRLLFGKISSPLQISDLCQDEGTPAGNPRLLKFAQDPNPSGDKDSILYFIRDGILDNTKKCERKPTNIVFTSSVGQQEIINLKDVTDLIFRMK